MQLSVICMPQGVRHQSSNHSELDGFAARHNLTRSSQYVVAGHGITIFDLRFRDADDYHPYRAEFRDGQIAVDFFSKEMSFHDGIAILRSADIYDPRKDVFLVSDPILFNDLSQAGFAVFRFDESRPDQLLSVLAAVEPFDFDEEAEMFAEPDVTTMETRLLPADQHVPDSEPFPVVLGRGALVGADNVANALTLMDRLTALMGGEAYSVTRSDDLIIGGLYEADGFSMEYSVVPTSDFPMLGHDGSLIEMHQYFDVVEDSEGAMIEETVDDGVQRLARAFGLCVAIEVPFDQSAGWLSGYKVGPDGVLVPLRFPYDAEAEVDE